MPDNLLSHVAWTLGAPGVIVQEVAGGDIPRMAICALDTNLCVRVDVWKVGQNGTTVLVDVLLDNFQAKVSSRVGSYRVLGCPH